MLMLASVGTFLSVGIKLPYFIWFGRESTIAPKDHPWNMVLHNAPANLDDNRNVTAWHWYLEITPRLTNPAGFEMGSGIYINTLAPEECASLLRDAL